MAELNNLLNQIKEDKDTNLLPENLREGVTVLGIQGTMKEGEDLNEQLDAQDEKIAELEAALENKTAGGKVKLNIYTQTTEPTNKDGIWLKKDINIDNIIRKDNINIEPSYQVNVDGTIVTLPSWIKQKNYNYFLVYYKQSSTSYNFSIAISKGGKLTYYSTPVYNKKYTCELGVASENGNGYKEDIINKLNSLTESNMTFSTSAEASYFPDTITDYSTSSDIYSPNGNIFLEAPPIETFENNTLIILQKDNNNSYKTILIDTEVENGINTYFKDILFSDENSEIDKTIETYYGNGTQWIKFKN